MASAAGSRFWMTPQLTSSASGQCRLLLPAHGQSEWNVDGRWQGDADPPLVAEGRHQAAHAASALADLGPFSAVVQWT